MFFKWLMSDLNYINPNMFGIARVYTDMHTFTAGDNIKLIRLYHALMLKYYSNFQTQVVLGILL